MPPSRLFIRVIRQHPPSDLQSTPPWSGFDKKESPHAYQARSITGA